MIQTYGFNAYASIKEVNIFTGKTYTIMNGKKYKMNEWISDAYGNIQFAIQVDDEGGFTYFKYDSEKDKLTPFFIHIDEVSYPLKVDAKSYLNQNLTFETFGYEKDVIYITSNIGIDKRKLLKYSLTEEKVIEAVAENINCDIKEIDRHGIQFVYDFYEEELAGIHYLGITPQYKWFSEKYRNIYSYLNKEYPLYFNEIIDSDAACKRFLVLQWSDDYGGNVGVFDTNDNSYAVMFLFNEELNKYKLSKTKNITAKARDDYKLPCYINFPPNYNGEDDLPLVVIPHGGPWSRDHWGFDQFSQYFATRGYATLRVNFRGSTGFGKSHVLAGISSIDEIMINDIADATQFVLDNYKIDPNKVFIFGHSYGGYATYMALLKYPNLYNSGVAVSAPTDIKEWMKKQKSEKNYFSIEFWNTVLGTNNSKYYSKISPINYTAEFTKPILIFHGKRDRTVSISKAEEMAERLKKDNKQFEFEILKTQGHSISDSNILGYVLDKSNEFFLPKEEEKK